MGQDPGQGRTTVGNEQPTPEELRRDIAQTREDLGDTAAALASKTDVKARAKEKVEDLKQTAAEKTASLKEATTPSGSGDVSSSAGFGTKASSIATQAKTKTQENPAIAAAGAAFLGGFLLGRLRSR
jgi:septal ring factor EnvC (AmiA/AmiB activator)